MTRVQAAALALLAPLLPAQGPTFLPHGSPLVSIRATQVPKLLEQWPNTALGKLFADEDARAAADLGVRFTANQLRRQTAMMLAVQQLEDYGDMQPYMIASLYRFNEAEVWRLLEQPVEQVQSVELTVNADPELGMRAYPRMLRTMSCRPRYEGQWTKRFDQEAAQRNRSKLFDVIEQAKVAGFPAYAYAVPKRELEGGGTSIPPQQWMLHLPGRFIFGNGTADEIGKLGAAPARPDAEICLEMDLEAYTTMFQAMGRGIDREFAALGFDKLKHLKWSGSFAGEMFRDVLDIELNGEPSGLVAALLNAEARLPDQALPKGALAQLRASVDLRASFEELAKLDSVFRLPPEFVDAVLAAFDGGLAFSCCAPPPGGLIPRLFLTANVKDGEAFDKLVQKLVNDNLPTKKLKFGDVEVTTLKIPDAPQGLQPAWCRVGDQLHVAESARSLRSFLKAQKGDEVAMDVDGMEVPAGIGEPTATFDLRYDTAAIYECFYTQWLPLFELSGVSRVPPPVRRRDLPEPEIVEEFLGKGRGVLRKDGNRYQLVQASATGGLETTALLFTYSTMLAPEMYDYNTERYSLIIARIKLNAVHEALTRFEKREQRRPNDLAELFTAEKLPDDALLLPGDDRAEPLLLPDGRKLRSSFRYYPKTTAFNGLQGGNGALMIEIRPQRYNRAVLCADGAVPDAYGSDCRKPIDQFGPGDSGDSASSKRDADFEYKLK